MSSLAPLPPAPVAVTETNGLMHGNSGHHLSSDSMHSGHQLGSLGHHSGGLQVSYSKPNTLSEINLIDSGQSSDQSSNDSCNTGDNNRPKIWSLAQTATSDRLSSFKDREDWSVVGGAYHPAPSGLETIISPISSDTYAGGSGSRPCQPLGGDCPPSALRGHLRPYGHPSGQPFTSSATSAFSCFNDPFYHGGGGGGGAGQPSLEPALAGGTGIAGGGACSVTGGPFSGSGLMDGILHQQQSNTFLGKVFSDYVSSGTLDSEPTFESTSSSLSPKDCPADEYDSSGLVATTSGLQAHHSTAVFHLLAKR